MERLAADIYASTQFPGVNVGVVALPDGLVAIDAPTLPADADAWREEMAGTFDRPLTYVVLTDGHPDRVLSASRLGATVVASRPAYERVASYTEGFWRGVVECWVQRFPEQEEVLMGLDVSPPEVLFTERVTLNVGANSVEVRKVAGGAPGSAWLDFRDKGILFSGDALVVGTHPHLEAAVDTEAWLATLRYMRTPRFKGTKIVPGRGAACDQSAVTAVSDYVALVRRRVRSWVRSDRGRQDKAAVVAELMELVSVPADEVDLTKRRIKVGLDRVYSELKNDD
jgi:glyoxylase-like metal-dependent hydrolase (beta-lactamase superfamily II)